VTVEQALRRSALAGHPLLDSGGVRLVEIPFVPMLNLRADPGPSLPGPGLATTDGARSVLWLGPDEFLVVGDGPPLGSTVDVSANRTTIELSGPNARDVLEHGCTLDLHPRVFRAGRCAQTMLARAQVILWQTSDEPVYRILVRGSFAGYLADWLVDAARPYA
jgi:sarcosine oxidase, subunit gamma